MKNPIVLFVFALPVHAISEDFETGDFSKLPWLTGGDGNWSIVSSTVYEGTYAAEAPAALSDSLNSYFEVTMDIPIAGDVSFYYKVSSETNYDFLKFYIDNIEQGSWSGEIDWTQTTYSISAGTHTFHWEYIKDDSVSSGADTAWIDNIAFPDTFNFTIIPTSVNTTEAGGTAAFTVKLNNQPTADVIIELSSSDATEGTVSASSLTFTNADWNIEQVVSVTGVDDLIDDGNVSYTIALTPALSEDTNYDGIDPNDANVTNIDDDPVWHVANDVTDSGNSTTWSQAFKTVQEAIDAADDHEQVWIKHGTYRLPSQIRIDKALYLYGGFAGTEATRDERDLSSNTTIIDGSSSVRCFYISTNAEINEITFAAGRASYGGGIFIQSSSPSITNCFFTKNQAIIKGGGVYNASASPLFVNCVFSGNSADNGAGIYNDDSSPTLIHCTFSINIAINSGGAMFNDGTSLPTLTNCILWNNGTEINDTTSVVSGSIVQGDYPGLGNHDLAPLFVGGASGNVRLSSNSPAIDTGMQINGLAADITGMPRPAGAGLDRGAYEFDPFNITTSRISGVTTEDGGTATFTVRLNSQPTADVTVGLSSSDTFEGTVTPSSLTFTDPDWNSEQTVTVTGVDDNLLDGDQMYEIILGSISSADLNFDGIDSPLVKMTNVDNEVPPDSLPGLPFTEEFSSEFLIDWSKTTAELNIEEQQVRLAWAKRIYPAFATAPVFDISPDLDITHAIAVDDIDGDGDLDVAVGQYDGVNKLYWNTGIPEAPFAGVAGINISDHVDFTNSIALADVNGDGHIDVVTGNQRIWRDGMYLGGKIRLYLNNGSSDPYSNTGIPISNDTYGTYSIALGDVNGDGHIDVVAGNYGLPNRLYLNNGKPSPFTDFTGFPISNDTHQTMSIALVDANGDGKIDVVAGNGLTAGQPNRLYLNNGTANPFDGITGINISADTDKTESIALADIDGDADIDVVAGN